MDDDDTVILTPEEREQILKDLPNAEEGEKEENDDKKPTWKRILTSVK